jgi:hypothetical protein
MPVYTDVVQGPEAVAQAVANTLTLYLNTALDEVWSSWSSVDGTLPKPPPKVYPASIYVGIRDVIPSYPAIEVMPTGGRMPENMATVWGGFQHDIQVFAWLQSDDKDVLNRQCTRYAWAIWKVLMKYQGLDGSLSGQAGVEPFEYLISEGYKKQQSALLLQAVGWRVTVNVEESV